MLVSILQPPLQENSRNQKLQYAPTKKKISEEMQNSENKPRTRQEYFNSVASKWDKASNNAILTAFLESMVPQFGIKKGQNILDIGTGTGILVPFLLKAVGEEGHVTAVDFAEKMVEICKTKYARHSNLTVLVGSAENLQFPDASFDGITCFGLFPHLENKEHALPQMNRVLKPYGKLVIAHALSSQEIKRHHYNAPSVVAHDELPNEMEMRQILKNAGFKVDIFNDAPGCYLCVSIKA